MSPQSAELCKKTSIFITFWGKKEVKLGKIQKKAVVGINCRP